MTRWVAQLSLDEGAALEGLPGTAGCHLPGSVGGGDATWDMIGARLPDPGVRGVRVVDAVALAPLCGARVVLDGTRVKRTLLMRVRPGTRPVVQEQFEAELAAMPRHIAAIRSWALSRVDHGLTPSRWTHVWEQEYESIDGLRGDYMHSPYHWAGVDRWFDGEVPGSIVEPEIAHVFYTAAGPVLS